jgi:hypothetical protein
MLLTHATLATMSPASGTEGYGLIPDAAVALRWRPDRLGRADGRPARLSYRASRA